MLEGNLGRQQDLNKVTQANDPNGVVIFVDQKDAVDAGGSELLENIPQSVGRSAKVSNWALCMCVRACMRACVRAGVCGRVYASARHEALYQAGIESEGML